MKTLTSPGDLVTLRNRIALLGPTDTRRWGSMSVQQMICHVTDAFAVPLDHYPATRIRVSRLPVPLLKWFALRCPMKWPHGVPTLAEIDQQRGNGTRPGDFAGDRATLLATLDRFAATAAPLPPHPIFGTMTRRDWMRWGYLHTDHHLRQFGR
jgi:hypothetical protein